jgi:hypothetical protein
MRKLRVSYLEINRVLRPVDAGQMKDDVGFKQPVSKISNRILSSKNCSLAVLPLKQVRRQIAAKKATPTGD